MVKTELALFQVQIKCTFLYAPKTDKSRFGVTPKALNAVYV